MADFEQDNEPEYDWEDSWENSWNEFNWERYLRGEDDEIAKYQALYAKLIRSSNRLDEIALFMGWQYNPQATSEAESSASEDSEPQPYTIHKHPLFVSSKALHGWLTEKWLKHVELCSEPIPTTKAMALQNAYSQSDNYGLLAVTALDLDDYALAIAYFKRGMVAINEAMALLAEFEAMNVEPLPAYIRQARIRLFDVREIWLRVTSDCRSTIARGSDDEQS